MQAYQEEFGRLAHGLLLYNNYDETYFVTRFIARLKDDIRHVIVLHRPKDVDTASALALIQGDELAKIKSKGFGKDYSKQGFKQFNDKHKGNELDMTKLKQNKADSEDKRATLKEYRRKHGLCFRCGDKWSQNHKCPAQVPLHVVEELLDALDDTASDCSEEHAPESEEVVMAVGQATTGSENRRKTMRLCAQIGKIQVLILIDTGSVGSFISPQLADQLPILSSDCEPATFMTADGSPMICQKKIASLQWSCQGHTFISSVGILPLRCFDMILGQDWLEANSPMWIHWGRKQMRFTHQGKRIMLKGVQQDKSKCAAVGNKKLKGLLKHQAISHCVQFQWESEIAGVGDQIVASVQETPIPEDIQKLIAVYEGVFQTPTSVPPPRPFDHQIP